MQSNFTLNISTSNDLDKLIEKIDDKEVRDFIKACSKKINNNINTKALIKFISPVNKKVLKYHENKQR